MMTLALYPRMQWLARRWWIWLPAGVVVLIFALAAIRPLQEEAIRRALQLTVESVELPGDNSICLSLDLRYEPSRLGWHLRVIAPSKITFPRFQPPWDMWESKPRIVFISTVGTQPSLELRNRWRICGAGMDIPKKIDWHASSFLKDTMVIRDARFLECVRQSHTNVGCRFIFQCQTAVYAGEYNDGLDDFLEESEASPVREKWNECVDGICNLVGWKQREPILVTHEVDITDRIRQQLASDSIRTSQKSAPSSPR